MKFTLCWLKDHLDTTATVDEIAAKLNVIGLEVEEIANPAAKLEAFVIAKVLEAKQHPNADKLRVCQVDTGTDVLEVVCGAPNARTGMIGVFAPTGTFVPGTGVKLEAKPVRGVVSNGMLCSERELELSNEHDGIIELPAELAKSLGKRYVDVMGLNDPVIEVKVTPNRPDALGVRGIARDLAACGLGTLKPADLGMTGGDEDCPVQIALDFPKGEEIACPAFAGRLIRGVKNGPSPAWLQARLKAVGLRPINALVDVTNYITMDRARPLHVYDAAKRKGTIHPRFGKAGESFEALDGKRYDVDSDMTVIADDSGVLALGGVMGGASTGSSEQTTDVFVESAWFDPLRTARTGRRTGIRSDARHRFERGVDPASLEMGLDLATKMIVEMCGGKPTKSRQAGATDTTPRVVAFNPARVKTLGGLDVPEAIVKSTLEALGFAVAGKGADLKVTIPTYRPDAHGADDLVEEVVRIVGIEKVPLVPMTGLESVPHQKLTEGQKRVRRSKRLLASRGLVEAITWSFISRAEAEVFGGGQAVLELENPISADMVLMRPSLLPGLIAAAKRNLDRALGDHGLFEVGQAYKGDQPDDQMMFASGVRVGSARSAGAGRSWDRSTGAVDAFDAKADVAALLGALGIDVAKAQVTRDAPAWFHPGRSGCFRLGPKLVLATFGELHPRLAKSLGLDGPAAAFEVNLTALPVSKAKTTRAKPALEKLSLQPVKRDYAFVLDTKVAAADVLRAVTGVDKKLIADAAVFDVFQGASLGEGKKSLAVEVTLQPRDETLTDKDIEAVSAKIVEQVKKATGGVIRT